MAFIGGAPAPNGERAPARVSKRDIARAFGVKGEAKAGLKLLITDLQAEGAVQLQRAAGLAEAARIFAIRIIGASDERPELAAAQNADWQPYLDWCKTKFGADLKTGSGVVPLSRIRGPWPRCGRL